MRGRAAFRPKAQTERRALARATNAVDALSHRGLLAAAGLRKGYRALKGTTPTFPPERRGTLPPTYSFFDLPKAIVRANLTPSQEAWALSRRKEIYEVLHPETRNGAAGNGRPKSSLTNLAELPAASFVDATAQATGMSPTSIRRVVARGDALGDNL